MTPKIKIAVRTADGQAQVFTVQHETIRNHAHAMELVRNEMPDAAVILALVPKADKVEVDQAA